MWTFQKREILPQSNEPNRIDIIQAKLDDIKKIKEKEITTSDINKTIEDKTFVWKWIGKFIWYVAWLWIDVTKYIAYAGVDIWKELLNAVLPDEFQKIIKDNLDWFVEWYNKKTKKDEIMKLVDEIYISNFSIRKEWDLYIVKNQEWKIIKNYRGKNILEIFNEPKNSLSEVLDEALIARSLTERWAWNILDIKRHLNIDITDENSIKKLKPENLANAYLIEYNVVNGQNGPISLDEVNEWILKDPKLKIPNHIVDYILMTKAKVFNNNDMWFLKDALGEYGEITTDTKTTTREIKEVAEWFTNNLLDVFAHPWEALSKINNPVSMLWLMAVIWYWLFFSDSKKTFWWVLLWILGMDAIVDIADWEKGKWLLDRAKKWNKKIFEWLDSDLKDKDYIKKLTEKPNELKLILELSTVKSSVLFENVNVAKDWAVSITNMDNLIKPENEAGYITVFGSKELFWKVLKDMIQNFLKLRKNWNETLAQIKERLEKKYNIVDYPNLRFGEVLFAELSENIEESSINQEWIQNNETDGKWEKAETVVFYPTPNEVVTYKNILSQYNESSPSKATLFTLFRRKKTDILSELNKITGISSTNKEIIDKLIKELKK